MHNWTGLDRIHVYRTFEELELVLAPINIENNHWVLTCIDPKNATLSVSSPTCFAQVDRDGNLMIEE